jgi:hypothetical protein
MPEDQRAIAQKEKTGQSLVIYTGYFRSQASFSWSGQQKPV